jgi:hypothetical protein
VLSRITSCPRRILVEIPLEDHELSATDSRRDPLRSFDDVPKVRLLRTIERRLHRHEDDVGFSEGVVVGRGFEPAVTNDGGELAVIDIADVARALAQLGDPFFVEVQRDDRETRARESDGERESDVAAADDCDTRRAIGDLLAQLGGAHEGSDTR